MRPLSSVVANGFKFDQVSRSLSDLGLISLRVGLRSYFETYKAMSQFLHAFEDKSIQDLSEVDYLHSTNYVTAYTQAIVHCHHFIELALKNILRDVHPLHAVLVNFKKLPALEAKLIAKAPVNDAEMKDLRSIEFSEALKRIYDLQSNQQLAPELRFTSDDAAFLDELNKLRNRLLHRGVFILRYEALDELFGRWLLPFVEKIVKGRAYSPNDRFWKWNPVDCGIDPSSEIVKVWHSQSYEMHRVGLLKELGRAAYEGYPRHEEVLEAIAGKLSIEHVKAAEAVAERLRTEVRNCPVCGFKTLVRHDEWETDQDTGEAGESHPFMLHCSWCSFEVDYKVRNPSEYGLSAPNIW